MSDSLSAGHAADEALKQRKTPCPSPKAKNRKHKWESRGSWPSTWEECKHCKQAIFYK